MTFEEQQRFIRKQRERRGPERKRGAPPREIHVCGGCGVDLTSKKCLRASFAPPDKAWSAGRFCDLVCLLDFLEDEEAAAGLGKIFTAPELVDRDLAVPVKEAAGS
jgi:hypothetical protein